MKILLLILLLMVGCQPTTIDRLDEVKKFYDNELNQTNYEIELKEANNNMLDDKYCEEYIERYR